MVLELSTVLENFIAGLLPLLFGIFIQITVKGDWLGRRLRGRLLFIYHRLLDIDSFNLLKMIPENLIDLCRLLPSLGLLVNSLDGGILDDNTDVNRVVHLPE